MRVISNAHFNQIDITQIDRWDHGPMELAYLAERQTRGLEADYAIHEWNASQGAGFLRDRGVMDVLKDVAPHLEARRNPNIVLVPTYQGTTGLDVMLSGLLPDAALLEAGIARRRGLLSLGVPFDEDGPKDYGVRARRAFSKHIWGLLAPRARLDRKAFSARSPLQLLAGDTRFWSHRIYRMAIERRDAWFEPTTNEDEGWEPLAEISEKILSIVPEEDRPKFKVHRPLTGGDIWDVFEAEEREEVLASAIDGDGVMASLDPVIELLHSHRTHEDFSDRVSWVKEDFERSFYSKRAALKVDLVETIDEAAAYDAGGDSPYEQVLFRDLLAFLDVRERRLCVAMRLGKTASDIANENGLRGHASVSRRIQALKIKVAKLLQ